MPTDVPTANKPAGQGTDLPTNPAKGTGGGATGTGKPATRGYDFNGKRNVALLTHPEHAGGNNEYNQLIAQGMNEFARQNPGYTPNDAGKFIEGRVDSWRGMYIKGEEFIDPARL